MSLGKRICKNCGSEFPIYPEDFKFYERMNVPPPTFCPSCRTQRRLVLRNERRLYRRKCDFWWGDGWNPLTCGRELDSDRPFLEQYKALQDMVPRLGLFNINSVNSEYNNYSLDNKDCYMNFRVVESERCYYNYYLLQSRDSANSIYLHKSELVYGSFNARNCYNSHFLVDCENSVDCAYSYDLRNCSNCLFSYNLRNKQYHVRNKPVSSEGFKRIWKEFINGSRIKTKAAKETLWDIYAKKAIHRYNKIIKSTNSRGTDLTNCKNVFEVYNGTSSENVRYGDDVETTRDSMDVKGPMNSELAYECCSIDNGCARIYFSDFCQRGCLDTNYSSFCVNSQNLFGCIGIRNGKYCILNKQYSPKDYEELRKKLVVKMQERGEFGENIGGSVSPFAYNETVAMEYFPLSKEKALSRGYGWQDDSGGTYNKETIAQEDVPDEIQNVPDTITREILKCEGCGRNYPISENEVKLYRRLPAPLPEKCHECRYQELLRFRLPRKLWRRQCSCEIKSHEWHAERKCSNEFETPHAPDKSMPVYCEECYLKEVV